MFRSKIETDHEERIKELEHKMRVMTDAINHLADSFGRRIYDLENVEFHSRARRKADLARKDDKK